MSEVEFPSVVICSQGFNMETVIGVYTNLILDKWKNETRSEMPLTPIQIAKLKAAKRTQARVKHHNIGSVLQNYFLYTFKLLTTKNS